MRRLNVKLLVGLIVGLLVTVVGVAAIHAYQIDKNADLLKRDADKAVAEGNLRDAVKKYSQYLKHRPNDVATQGKMALLAADIVDQKDADKIDVNRAFHMLDSASKIKELVDVRRRNADFLIKIVRYVEAMDQLEELLAAAANEGKSEPELAVKYAACKIKTGHEDEALHILNQLIGFDEQAAAFDAQKATAPATVDAYLLVADILRRRFDDAKRADAVMEQLVIANPDMAKAHLALGRYNQRLGRPEKAVEHLDKALELAPNDADVIVAAADIAIGSKKFDQARELLERGVKEYPKNEAIYRELASLALAQNNVAEALEHITAGLAAAPESANLLLFQAELQLQQGDIEALRRSLDKMREENFAHELIGYFMAQIAVQERKWLAASRQLEKLRPQMARFPRQLVQIDLLLGRCYENLGQPDKQLEAYRRAMDADPLSIEARLGHTQALLAVGKRKEGGAALEQLNQALQSPQIRNHMLQLQISDQLQKPLDDRDWHQVDQLVNESLQDKGLSETQKGLLTAEIAIVKGELNEADKQLVVLAKKYPESIEVWMTRVNLLQQKFAKEVQAKGKLSEDEQKSLVKANVQNVLRVLATAEKAAGKKPQFLSARVLSYARLPVEEAKPALAKFEEGIEKRPETEQLALWADLGNAYYRLRDYDNVRRCWTKIADSRPEEPKPKQSLFELAKEFNDEKGMKGALESIGKLFGTTSAIYKCCLASELVWEFRSNPEKNKKALAEARTQVDEALRARPDWHELFKVRGEIDELEGKNDSAIADYQRALELGPPNSVTARRLVMLLYRYNRMAEVQQAMKFVGRTGGSSDVIEKIDAESKGLLGDRDAGLEMAEKIVADDPSSAQNRLWYGQLLARAGHLEQAEEQYREGVKADPENAQGWLMLINHLVATKQKDAAQSAIAEAEKGVKGDILNPLLGQAYELLGDRDKAEEYTLAALEAHPDEPSLLRATAVFYLKGNQLDKARPLVEKLLAAEVKPDDRGAVAHAAWARRAMAEILARTGDFQDVQQAVKLIEGGRPDGKATIEDTLVIAGLLAARPDGPSRQRAVQLLEKLQAERPLSPQDQLTLAGLYERAGDWSKARDQMLNLIAKLENNPLVLGNFVQMMLRHDEIEDVDHWLDKLVALRPNASATIELKARWLAKQGRTEDAAEYLASVIPDPLKPEQYPILGNVGLLLEDLRQYSAAERILRDYYKREPKSILVLAGFLGRRGSVDEAFALLEKARQSQSVGAVIQAGLQTLRARPEEIGQRQFDIVDGWLQEALSEDPQSASLQLQLAELRDQEGRLDDVVDIYRGLTGRSDIPEKQRAIVKNNLAFSLAARGSKQDLVEAEKTASEAVAFLGPISDVLDTRAMVRLAKGDVARAKADVQAAIDDVPSAGKYFHLALIAEKAGNKTEMADAFNRSLEMKLDPDQLPPNERKAFDRLQQELVGEK